MTIAPEKVLAEIQAFITGTRPALVDDRMLATGIFVDIANSTQTLSGWGSCLQDGWRITIESCATNSPVIAAAKPTGR